MKIIEKDQIIFIFSIFFNRMNGCSKYMYIFTFINFIFMKQKVGFDKITQVISLSNNYVRHKKNLRQVKSLVDTSTKKRNTEFYRILNDREIHSKVKKKEKEKSLVRQNNKFVKRLCDISEEKRTQNSFSHSRILHRTSSQKSLGSKARSTFLKNKEIARENIKIAERILNSRSKDRLGPQRFRASQRQNQEFKKVHGRYSNRSQHELKQMMNGMKMKPHDVPFLPQIQPKRYHDYSSIYKRKL